MARPSAAKLALLQKRLADRGMQTKSASTFPRRDRSEQAPLSYGQQRLWFLEQLEPGTSLYNDCLTVSLEGGVIDTELFQRCVDEITERHEVLRTTYPSVLGKPVQKVNDGVTIQVVQRDLRTLPEAERRAEAERVKLELVKEPYDLLVAPLVRATLVRLADESWEFAMCMHHIASDGVSYGIFYRELGALYAAYAEGRPSPLAPMDLQFGDYAAWERSNVDEQRIAKKLPFWIEHLGGELPHMALPFDRPRPIRDTDHRGAFHRFSLPDELYQAMEIFGRKHKKTPHWILLGGFFALLHSYGRQDDLRVGLGSALRTRTELENMIGFFVQTTVMRCDMGGSPSFVELITRTQQRALAVAAYEEVPYDRIVQAIRPRRNPEDAPIIQAWFGYMKDLIPCLELPGMQSSYQILDPKTARFDLGIILDDARGKLDCYFEYDVNLFDAATVSAIADRYLAILSRVMTHPETTLASVCEAFPPVEVPSEGTAVNPARRQPKKMLKKVRRREPGA